MPPPPANDRCDFAYAGGATDVELRNSLTGEGPLLVAATHWFSAVMGHVLSVDARARVRLTMRLVNYVVEADVVYDDAVRALNPSFTADCLLAPEERLAHRGLLDRRGRVVRRCRRLFAPRRQCIAHRLRRHAEVAGPRLASRPCRRAVAPLYLSSSRWPFAKLRPC